MLRYTHTLSPWRIRNLKYLEMKIEEWPSRVKRGQMGSNGSIKGQKGPYRPNMAKRGQMGSYGADFLHEIKTSCLATQALTQKLAELWGFWLIPRF